MLMEAKKNIKLILTCLKYNIIKEMDNRISFIFKIIGMVINNAMMIIQWIVLFSLKDNIGGYGFKEVLLLWGFASASYGFAHILFENAFNLSRIITCGKLDAFLVQPQDTLLYMSTSSSSISALGDIIYGIILLVITNSNVLIWVLFTLLSILGGLLIASYSVICHSLSFWFGNMSDFANVMNSNMINIATYPEGIFTKEIRWLLLTLIPVSFTVYVPIKIVTELNITLLLIMIVVCIIFVVIAYIIFNLGLKKYSSSNLMSARI